jgi:hypothetical protein
MQPEHGQAGEVGGGGEQVEVGVDFDPAAYSCSASAVAAAHEVAEFAFDFGPGGSVVALPAWIGLTGPGAGQDIFVGADADGAPSGGGGALGGQWASGARRGEGGDPTAVAVPADRRGHPARAGDSIGAEVDTEAALAEQATRRRRRLLGLASRADVVILQVGLELAASVRAIAVDLGPGVVLALTLAVSRPWGLLVWGLVVVVGCRVGWLVTEVDDEVFGYGGVPGVAPG